MPVICSVPPIVTVVEAVGPVEVTMGALLRLTTDKGSAPLCDVKVKELGMETEKLMFGPRLVTSNCAGLPLSGPTR
jgi:hypothetical protein